MAHYISHDPSTQNYFQNFLPTNAKPNILGLSYPMPKKRKKYFFLQVVKKLNIQCRSSRWAGHFASDTFFSKCLYRAVEGSEVGKIYKNDFFPISTEYGILGAQNDRTGLASILNMKVDLFRPLSIAASGS